jgi:hypothetical protein
MGDWLIFLQTSAPLSVIKAFRMNLKSSVGSISLENFTLLYFVPTYENILTGVIGNITWAEFGHKATSV